MKRKSKSIHFKNRLSVHVNFPNGIELNWTQEILFYRLLLKAIHWKYLRDIYRRD